MNVYAVYFRGRKLSFLGTFDSYDRARSAARSYIRRQVAKGKLSAVEFGYWDSISRNPANLGDAGFRIKAVA